MRYLKRFALVLAFIMLFTLTACSAQPVSADITASPSREPGQIYLYGESHGNDLILDKEFALWDDDYHNKNMRHLFIENSYYGAEFLNIWMKSDNDDILEALRSDCAGTEAHSLSYKEFYQKIKRDCPETVFHGTDVGHQYNTTGARFLKYLEENKLKGSEQYILTRDAIEQGKYFDAHSDNVYRENKMADNFIREFDSLNGESIMGIFGGAHVGLDAMDAMTNSVPCMANQLKAHYGDAVHSEELANKIEPDRVDTMKINGKAYEASHFGKEDTTSWSKNYVSREIWRLENAYDDLKSKPKTGTVLPNDNYPMRIETGQVFVIDYKKANGYIYRAYYRTDGNVLNGKPISEEFNV